MSNYTDEELKRMRVCAAILEPPANEVVAKLCEDLEESRALLADAQHEVELLRSVNLTRLRYEMSVKSNRRKNVRPK